MKYTIVAKKGQMYVTEEDQIKHNSNCPAEEKTGGEHPCSGEGREKPINKSPDIKPDNIIEIINTKDLTTTRLKPTDKIPKKTIPSTVTENTKLVTIYKQSNTFDKLINIATFKVGQKVVEGSITLGGKGGYKKDFIITGFENRNNEIYAKLVTDDFDKDIVPSLPIEKLGTPSYLKKSYKDSVKSARKNAKLQGKRPLPQYQ